MALPQTMNAVAGYKLRQSAMDLETLLQRARTQAVRDNRHESLVTTTVTNNSVNYTQVFLDANSSGYYDSGEPSIQLPRNVSLPTSGTPSGLSSSLNFTPQSASVVPSFNARGTPCVVRNSVCSSWDANGVEVGFVFYVRSTGITGTSWAAVSASPSGRMRVWSYDSHSGAWTN
jgi:Tfp pilus assembly protein FimT